MKALKWILPGLWIITLVFGTIFGFKYGRKGEQIEPPIIKVDTLVIRDTIKVTEPVYVTRRVVDSVAFPVIDTLRMRDTLFVYLEREQVRWEDSLAVVYASGIQPQVDSVIHHTREHIITQEIPVIQVKKTRWGLGVQAGMGATRDGLTPYVGIGVSYNLLAW